MTTTMLIKLDKELKENAQKVAKNFGIPLSTLIRSYLKELTATGRLELNATETMTPQMEKIIKQAELEIKKGQTAGPFADIDQAIDFLKNRNK